MLLYTVYLDQVFIGNLVINYAILWATAKVTRKRAAGSRLAAGATLSAAYTLVLFMPHAQVLLSLWCKLAVSGLIIIITFSPLRPKQFLSCLGAFYFSTFILAGLVLGLIFFSQPAGISSINGTGLILAENMWYGLVLGMASFMAIIRFIEYFTKKRLIEKVFKLNILIKSQGIQVKLEAFLDTGNQLVDPMTGRPVIVAEYDAVKALLPVEVQGYFERSAEPDVWQVLHELSDNIWITRFSAIPFSSLGQPSGLLVGYRPDEISLKLRGELFMKRKAVIAVYHKKIDPEDRYQALLHPRLMEIS